MTYTAWDYRKLAEYHEQLGNAIIAKHYLAHADLLDWKARIEAAQGEDVREAVISLKKRAQIRREIPGRKSVELGEPDRIANQLDHAATLLESLSARLAELNETWMDEHEVTWRSPTAWSYAMTCRALEDTRNKLAEREAEVAKLKAHAKAIAHDYFMSWAGDLTLDEFNEYPVIAAYRADFPEGAK